MRSGARLLCRSLTFSLCALIVVSALAACTATPTPETPALVISVPTAEPTATIPAPTVTQPTIELATNTPIPFPSATDTFPTAETETSTPTWTPTLTWTPINVLATLHVRELIAPTPTVTLTPIPTLPPPPDIRLRSAPVFYNFDAARLREIFAQGQQRGNRAQVFIAVGDSNTINGDFLKSIGYELAHDRPYCEWGNYAYLQETARFFSVSPDGVASNSFTRDGAAARMGFNSAALLDPFWANHARCNGADPLTCDYQTARPAVAVIMLGGIDVREMNAADYRANMTQAVERSLQNGVIPLLTTFVVLPERADIYPASLEFNAALLDISDAYGVPLINLWSAAQALPDWGIGPDRTHLRARPGDYCTFTGAQNQLGGTLRNLLTLQALDLLRTQVLGG